MIDPNILAWTLAFAAHLYYHSVGDEQSPLSDYEYDELVKDVSSKFDVLDNDIKKILISPEDMLVTTYYIKLSNENLAKANLAYLKWGKKTKMLETCGCYYEDSDTK